MLTNREIKKKELFKANQKLIKVLGEFKKAQQEYLYATNELALDELDNPNALTKGVHSMKFKWAVKNYIDTYGKKVSLERYISQLKEWKAEE